MGVNYHENIRTPSPSVGNVAAEEKELGPLPEESSCDSVIDVPPDGGYGWVCVGCVFMVFFYTTLLWLDYATCVGTENIIVRDRSQPVRGE
jgi:hypothetical protein